MACGLRQTGFAGRCGPIYGIRARERAESPKRKGPAIVTGPSIACSQPLVTTGGGGALPLPTPYVCAEAATLKRVSAAAVSTASAFMAPILCHDKRK